MFDSIQSVFELINLLHNFGLYIANGNHMQERKKKSRNTSIGDEDFFFFNFPFKTFAL
jgi:hypothetical protein